MNSPGTTTQQRDALYARRRDAIISSIYELFLSVDDPAQISVLDVFNRLMLLLQSACMFVLVKYEQKTGEIIRNQNTYKIFNPHPGHQDRIKEAVTTAHDDSFIEIFGSSTYKLIVLLASQNTTPLKSSEYSFSPINDTLKNRVKEVLDRHTYHERFGYIVLMRLTTIIDNCKGIELNKIESNGHNLIDDEKDYEYWHGFFIAGLQERQHVYELPSDGVIDKAYNKSKKSLSYQAETEKKPELANFLFFLRDYSVDNLDRAGNYNFGLRILLCSKQEEDIREFLSNLRQKNNLSFWYSDLINDSNNKYYKIGKAANKDFWRRLQSTEENKQEMTDLIEIIKKPLGRDSYSMAEQTFLSGLVHFRNPSVNAGLHRCVPEDKIISGYESLDKEELLRVVIVHYLLLGMAHSFDELKEKNHGQKDFSVMLAPISIGGRILGVLSYVTEKDKTQDEDDERVLDQLSIEQISQAWRKNFHTYTATHKRIKRHLRTYFWCFYVRMVFEMYCESLVVSKKLEASPDEFQDIFNKRLSYLDRFFSYNSIECLILDLNLEKIYSYCPNMILPTTAKISEKYGITFAFDKTAKFFSFYSGIEENNLERFVDATEIAIRIADACYGHKRHD